MSTSVCRVCLAGDIRMHIIEDIHFLETYEKLASAKLDAEVGMPNTACYICYSQLRRCRRFSDVAQRSDKILRHLFDGGNEVTHTSLNMLKLDEIQNLSVTPTQYMSIDYNSHTGRTLVTVREEHVDVKEETTAEDEEMIETEEGAVVDDFEISDSLNIKEQSIEGGGDINNMDLYFYCDVCNKSFALKTSLARHLRSHTEEKPYACNRCDKKYRDKSNLTIHMCTHTGEKPFSCNRCEKAFSSKNCLINHIRIHTGEKPYACNRCDTAFCTKGNFSRHMRMHAGVKPYACNICVRAFKQKHHLLQHMLIHTRDKPYACNRCDKAFTQNSTLTRHMLIHTCEKPDEAFNHKVGLTRHMRIHAGEKPKRMRLLP